MNSYRPKKLAGFALVVALAGCGGDGTNPFLVDEEITSDLEEGDPNTSVDNKFAWDPENGLTMNDVEVVENADGSKNLVINNLPFDGSTKTYDETSIALPGSTVYQSRTETIGGVETDGVITYYAVYIETDHLQATAVAGREWGDFGYAGANVKRDSYTLPDVIDGVGPSEFRYSGVYAGTRKMEDGSQMELTSGKLDLLLDIKDFDESGDIEGAITGTIYDKQTHYLDGTVKNDLPNVALKVVSFDAETGTWVEGSASTNFPDSSDTRDSGTYEGMLAGEDAAEVGGHVVMSGTAHAETVLYQIVTYEIPQFDPITGAPLTDPNTGNQLVIEGTYSALEDGGSESAQALVDQGLDVPTLTVNAGDLPAGAVVTETVIEDDLFVSDFLAREVGVFAGDQITGPFD